MQIELKVDGHLSGRMTLKRRNQNDMGFKDYPAGGPLFGNDNAGKFYRAVAQELANLASQGHDVQYRDIQSLDDFPAKAVSEFGMGGQAELPEARRFGERLLKHGLTLVQASWLALKYVPEEPYIGEPEKAADAFFAMHGHKYK